MSKSRNNNISTTKTDAHTQTHTSTLRYSTNSASKYKLQPLNRWQNRRQRRREIKKKRISWYSVVHDVCCATAPATMGMSERSNCNAVCLCLCVFVFGTSSMYVFVYLSRRFHIPLKRCFCVKHDWRVFELFTSSLLFHVTTTNSESIESVQKTM